MKWIMTFSGFMLYTVLGTIGVGWLMAERMLSSNGGIFIIFAAPVIGAAFGLVGIRSGYYVYKKEYVGAASVTLVFAFSIALVIVSIFS